MTEVLQDLGDEPTAPGIRLRRAERKDWVARLPPPLQGELLLAVRCHDARSGKVLSHPLPRQLRAQVFDDPDPAGAAPLPPAAPEGDDLEALLQALDACSLHFFRHLLSGAGIVASYHPEAEVRAYFGAVHQVFCARLHIVSAAPWRQAPARGALERSW